jgi:hypothetical protein
MNIQQLIKESYWTAQSKGWWDGGECNVPEKLALMHSEISEALEEVRKGKTLGEIYYGEDGKPEGFLVEIADLFIRAGDFIGAHDLDEEFMRALKEKLAFNKTRPYRHGGKTC